MDSKKLMELGFDKVGSELQEKEETVKNLEIAQRHYKYISQEDINKFNERLKAQTIKRSGKEGKDLIERYDKLSFTNIKEYETVPPDKVLTDLAAAKEKNCFDTFEIAKIESVVEQKDPILFGKVKGCDDLFHVSQWGSDISMGDIVESLLGE